jgi:type IV pilus assembly protein PilF
MPRRLGLSNTARALLLRLGAGLLLLALTACTTVTRDGEGREVRVDTEQVNPERRAQVRLELASLYYGRGQFDTALAEVAQALDAKPDSHEAFSLQGLIYAALGDPAQADQSFRRALRLRPNDPSVLNNHGWFLCQQRRFDEADAQFNAAVAQPGYRDAVRTLLAQGVCQARAERWADAERTLSRSYQLDPTNPTTAFNLADVLLRRGELERARFYTQRINSQPPLVTAQSLWLAARIERRLGKVDAVRDYGRQLRERFPGSPEALKLEQGRFDE